jgi:hypothetical protein
MAYRSYSWSMPAAKQERALPSVRPEVWRALPSDPKGLRALSFTSIARLRGCGNTWPPAARPPRPKQKSAAARLRYARGRAPQAAGRPPRRGPRREPRRRIRGRTAQAARAAQAPAQGRPRDRWRVARAVGIERFIHDRLGQPPGTRRPHLSVEALGGALRGRLAAVEVFAVERNKRPSAGALSRNNATDQSSAGMIRIALGGCASASPPFRQLTAQRISGFG